MRTVFHSGEVLMQTESAVDKRTAKIGNKLIRHAIIEQHKFFFEGLEYVFIALHDNDGRPWLSFMQGPPGFINSPDEKTLNLNGGVIAQDQLCLQTGENKPVGIVGLDLSTRRRNRLNGNFNSSKHGNALSIVVGDSFGNCPKYIQLRDFKVSADTIEAINPYEHFVNFGEHDINLIKGADTLLIASAEKENGNLDASHRGGKPGFVRVDDNKQLWFNDYPGNNFFQTFGNIHNYDYVGLMFIDFNSGDLLLLSGKARIENEGNSESPKFLPRRIYFTLDRGLRVKSAINGKWSSVEISPFLSDDLD